MRIVIEDGDDDRTVEAIDRQNRALKRAEALRKSFGSAGERLAAKYDERAEFHACQALTLRTVASIPKAYDL